MDYHESLEFLTQLTKFGFNLGLDRIRELLKRLGHPERRLRFIHIGGTNGKGSVAAMTASILTAAGYRTGLFTSPHLNRWNERIQVDGQEIADADVAALLTLLKPILLDMAAAGYEHPTEFEVCTAASLLYFAEAGADVVVLEVGLGGSIDSTNAIPASLASVITNVGLDHMDYLGHTIAAIAAVKAGIIKEGGVVVTAADRPDALHVIEAACRERRATLYRVGRDVTYIAKEVSLAGGRLDVQGELGDYRDLRVGLLGRHQLANAATAVATVAAAVRHGGLKVAEQHIRQGLRSVRWPARLELVGERPLLLIDGAHNFDGALTLRQALLDLFPGRRLVLVISMLADKERERVVELLAPLAAAVVVTKPLNPRAGAWWELADAVRRHVADVAVVEELPAALQAAFDRAGPEDMILSTGSLYMVSEARKLLLERKKEDLS